MLKKISTALVAVGALAIAAPTVFACPDHDKADKPTTAEKDKSKDSKDTAKKDEKPAKKDEKPAEKPSNG